MQDFRAFIARLFARTTASSMDAVAVTVVGLLAADLLYRWVELPMIDVGRRIITRRREKTVPVPGIAEPALVTA